MNQILQGDVIEQLKTLPDGVVQTCVTSPPYWGLRDYGEKGQLGLEKTPEEYTEKMVKVFREVRRVLRDDGVLWLNLGDTYNSPSPGARDPERWPKQSRNDHKTDKPTATGLKQKDLVGIPWMVAFALRSDGWYLRGDIIWSKPNPMPEGVDDRPTKAHEYIFLLSKSGGPLFWIHREKPFTREKPEPDYRWVDRKTGIETAKPQANKKKWKRINLWKGNDYYYDEEAIKEPASSNTHSRGKGDNPKCYAKPAGWQEDLGAHDRIPKGSYKSKQNPSFSSAVCEIVSSRNKRSVWEVASYPFPEAHFAAFPPKLIEPCILAGSASKKCIECGAPWYRLTHKISLRRDQLSEDHPDYRPGYYTDGKAGDSQSPGPGQKIVETKTIGFKPTCLCNKGTEPSIVLDPFIGTGTTGLVAEQKGRRYIGIELSAGYIKIAKKRLSNLQPEMFV